MPRSSATVGVSSSVSPTAAPDGGAFSAAVGGASAGGGGWPGSSSGAIVHVCVAGVASALPAASLARTLNVCAPVVRPLYSFGLEHVAKLLASSLHSNVAPASLAVNANEALVESVDASGPDVIVVSGGVVSAGVIVHVRVAGVASVLPAGSVARTLNVCAPTPRPL